MTNEEKQRLNEKLARWAGLKVELASDEHYHWFDGEEICSPTVIEDGVEYIPFTDSLDACIEWLVPKLHDLRIYWELHQGVGYCPMAKLFWNEKAFWKFTNLKWIFMSEETPALALCLAIEKLIDKDI